MSTVTLFSVIHQNSRIPLHNLQKLIYETTRRRVFFIANLAFYNRLS